MGNQQERSLSWLAGILDGEGSISVQVYTLPDGRVRFTPFVSVINTDEGILVEVMRIFSELTANARSGKPRLCKGQNQTNKPVWNIRCDGGPCVKAVLLAVRPYLYSSKRRNADVVLAYIASRDRNLLRRDEKGRIQRGEYTREEVNLICSIRSHKSAKSSEAICRAPNVQAA